MNASAVKPNSPSSSALDLALERRRAPEREDHAAYAHTSNSPIKPPRPRRS
ncbi:hypothetical protein NRB56_08100 [Nocardia sp. RB56]|uniref:Uncharacterized protein n=1 Tax=Nocardia aurantia TaxID=2585199 RepID=A0A7K0DKD8_9NOCA|nr:hypothetical protein [Nocardia aurantia]